MSMSDISSSTAYQEFLQKQESSITDDETYKSLNRQILELEKKIIPTLPEESLEIFLNLDSLNIQLIEHITQQKLRQSAKITLI
jgi:hypothetical protein